MIRCKFYVESIKDYPGQDGTPSMVTMRAVQNPDPSIPEDQQFVKFTPYGALEVQISNQRALEQLRSGGRFYLDIIPICDTQVS